MANATIASVVDGWAGTAKRQRVILTLSTTNADAVPPAIVGLREIHAIQLTNRTGTLDGRDGAVASVTTATITNFDPSTNILNGTAAKFEVYIYGK